MTVRVGISRTTPFGELPEYLTPDEVRQYLGIGRGTCYDLLRRGDIPSVRFGRLIRVPKIALPNNTETLLTLVASERLRGR